MDERSFVHEFDQSFAQFRDARLGIHFITGVDQALPAVLERFFDEDADAGDVRACHAAQTDRAHGGFPVGKEIVDDQDAIVGRYIIHGKGQLIAGPFCKRCDIRLVNFSVEYLGSLFFKYDHGHAERLSRIDGGGDAGTFDRQYPRDALIFKMFCEIYPDTLHQIRIDLMIQKDVHLQYGIAERFPVLKYSLTEQFQ